MLLGAVGGPKWDDPKAKVRPEQGLLAIRKGLGLYANLRPVAVNPRLLGASTLRPEVLAGVDMIVVRELTGGIYFGDKVRDGDRASDMCVYTVGEVERIVRVAARLCRGRKKKLTSVDKANVLETSRLWREVTTRVMRDEFPDVALSHMLVDACAMHLIRRPADFDVIVTENMFGDILTDEASMLAGSMGMLPSASLGDGTRGPVRAHPRLGARYRRQGNREPLRHDLERRDAAPALAGAFASRPNPSSGRLPRRLHPGSFPGTSPAPEELPRLVPRLSVTPWRAPLLDSAPVFVERSSPPLAGLHPPWA